MTLLRSAVAAAALAPPSATVNEADEAQRIGTTAAPARHPNAATRKAAAERGRTALDTATARGVERAASGEQRWPRASTNDALPNSATGSRDGVVEVRRIYDQFG